MAYGQALPQRSLSKAHYRAEADALRRGQAHAAGAGGEAANRKRVDGGFAPGSLIGIVDAASIEGSGAAAQDTAVDQPNREHVLLGATQ